MAESSATGGWWDLGGYYHPWTLPYVGDFPPPYLNQTPPIMRPDTKQFDFAEIFKPQPSREQIEKELLQKIAAELISVIDDGNGYLNVMDWVDEIIEKYYVEPKD